MNKNTIINMVGKTPILRAEKLEKYLGVSKIYLKLEGNNPSGHRIDRVAHLLIKDAVAINKKTICVAGYGSLSRSLAVLSQYYKDLKIVLIYPKKTRARRSSKYEPDNIEIIHYGKNQAEGIKYSEEICNEKGWYNATLGIDNNILNMTALSSISTELNTQITDDIDSVFSLMSYGFSTSGISLGFRSLWNNDIIKKLPKLYSCTVNDGNVIYESFKKKSPKIIPLKESTLKLSRNNKHLLNFDSTIAQDALESIYDANGTIIGISEEELLRYTAKFKELEKVKFSTEQGYAIAGLMKEAENGNLVNGNHVIILNDGRVDLNVRRVEIDELDMSIDELVSTIDEWMMEYTDPHYEIREAIQSAFQDGFVIMAFYNNQLAGVTIVIHTGFEVFIPTYHLGYIATKKSIKGRGIATQLLTKAIETSKGKISLHVERNNNRAIKLYEKMGFEKSYLRMIYKNK
jgi:threonine synthase